MNPKEWSTAFQQARFKAKTDREFLPIGSSLLEEFFRRAMKQAFMEGQTNPGSAVSALHGGDRFIPSKNPYESGAPDKSA